MRNRWRAAPCILMAGLFAGCSLFPSARLESVPMPEAKSATNLTIHVVDVGQGNCIIIECPGGGPVMNDCGSTSYGALSAQQIHDYVSGVIAPYVTLSNPSPLEIFVSHSDEDHLNLIYDPTYGVNPAVAGTIHVSERGSNYSDAWSDWVKKTPASKAGRYYHFDGTGPYLDKAACGKAVVDVIAVNAKYDAVTKTGVPNADSIVLRVRYGTFTGIFTGDAEGVTENLAMSNVSSVDSNLLLGSHHGADTKGSNGKTWAQQTDPQTVIFSAGHNDQFGHPRCTVIQRYIDNAPNLVTMAGKLEVDCGEGSSRWGDVDTKKGVLTTYVNDTIVVTVGSDYHYRIACGRNQSHCNFP